MLHPGRNVFRSNETFTRTSARLDWVSFTTPKSYRVSILAPVRIRKGRTPAIVLRRGSYESLFLLNSGRFSLDKLGNSILNFGSRRTV